MATLTSPHWQTITDELRGLITALGQQPFLDRFYLAGGTALALQIGHRRSIDLDFFSTTDEVDETSRQEIILSLAHLRPEVVENAGGNLLMLVGGIHLGFFSYPYPLVQEAVCLENVRLASLADIGLMKCDALITRGSRKDFYDLFFITRQIPLQQLLQLGEQKYSYYRDFPFAVLEHMVIFNNADRDVQPFLFEEVSWQDVRDFFLQQASHLGRTWLQE